jgi:ABC-type transport system substrate-binding protein
MKGLGYAPSTPENDKAKLKQLELKLMVRSYDPSSLQYKELDTLTNYFRTQWSQIGVVLVVEPEDEGSFNDRLGSKDYDLVLSGQNLGYNGDLYSFWHSTQAGENGLNLSNYRSFAVDNFIEKIRLSFDKEERVNLMTVLAATINEDYPAIFLYQPSYLLATDDKVKDISMQNLAYPSDRYSLISQWCVMNCQ